MPGSSVVEVHDDRRVFDEPRPTVAVGGEAGHRPHVVFAQRAGDVALGLGAVALREVGDDVVGGRAVVPDGERPHAGELVDVLAVDTHGLEHHAVALRGREPVFSCDDVQAGGEALDVPLPRTAARSRRSR